jgi:uncharacterized protein (DUF2141 family)
MVWKRAIAKGRVTGETEPSRQPECLLHSLSSVRSGRRSVALSGAALSLVLFGPAATARPLSLDSPATGVLTVNVKGLRNAKGKVDALLFRSAEGFPKDSARAFDAETAPIDPTTLSAQVIFQHVPPGVAAVTVLHDENMNEKLDTNLIGIPREGYGASNNPQKHLRAPTFAEAQFLVRGPKETIQITVIYW